MVQFFREYPQGLTAELIMPREMHTGLSGRRTEPVDVRLGISRPIQRLPPVSDAYTLDEQIEFLMEIALALQAYGEPAHTLEDTMRAVASRMRVESSFFATPTTLYAAFGRYGAMHTRMARVEVQRTDLARLRHINAVARDVGSGEMSPQYGVYAVREIVARRPRYSSMPWAVGLPALQAGAIAMVLNGSAWDTLASTVLGVGTGGLIWAFGRSPRAALLLTFVAALYAAFASFGLQSAGVPISPLLVTICAVVAFMPGLSFTTSLLELSTRNLLAGTSRLMHAFLILMQLGVGMAFGLVLAGLVWTGAGASPILADWPWWWPLCGAVLYAVSLYFDFRAARSDFLWIFGGCVLTFVTYLSLRDSWGVEPSIFMAAIAAGVLAEGYARWTGRPLSVMLVPSITLLVPGILGFRTISSLVLSNIQDGLDLGFSMAMTGIALASGVLMASMMFDSTRTMWHRRGGAISRWMHRRE